MNIFDKLMNPIAVDPDTLKILISKEFIKNSNSIQHR